MKQLVFANYIVILKKYAKKPTDAYQFFLTDLFRCIGRNKKKYGTYMLASNAASRIMTREYDVPEDIRDIINESAYNEIKESMKVFISEYMNAYVFDSLVNELKEFISNASNLTDIEKDKLLGNEIALDLITETLIFVVRIDNRLKLNKKVWSNGKNSIFLLNGDLMALSFNAKEKNKEKIVVIPFDKDYHLNITRINSSYPEVSIETLHGQWIKRMQDEGLTTEDIKKEIDNGVINRDSIGSISKVYHNNVLFYLVGLSIFDENNKAHSSRDAIKICVANILEEYDKTGQGAPIYIPLLGTGRSRIGLSYVESIKAIKEECLKHKENIQGTVNIIVYTKNLEEIGDDISEL